MTPVLVDRYSYSLIGVLDDCISCTVTEEVNGVFECEFQYPMTGAYYEHLINYGGTVNVQFNQTQRDNFDIYKYSAPIDGIVTFNASHVSYRLSSLIVAGGWTATDPYDALAKIAANVLTTNDFSFATGTWQGDAGTLTVNGYANARELMLGRGEEVSSIVNTWNCEFIFSDRFVDVREKRGSENGVQVRYGKNITDILREKDSGGIISAVFPFWHSVDGSTYVTGSAVRSPKLEDGLSPWEVKEIVYTPSPSIIYKNMTDENGENLYFTPAIVNAAAVDFSEKFNNAPTNDQLQSAALKYMSKNSTWRSSDNISVNFLDLHGTPEYADIKGLEECNVGDYVSVFYPQLGVVTKKVEIVSATFDALGERYIEMQLGTLRTTLAEVIIQSIGGDYS